MLQWITIIQLMNNHLYLQQELLYGFFMKLKFQHQTICQIVIALSLEFSQAVYQTIAFGSFYLIKAFWIDNSINYSLIALILGAMVILISSFYENIRALRSQFKLGKNTNQWELIFKSLIKEQDYMIFNYNENSYSFSLNQQCLHYQILNTQDLRNILRSTKTEQNLTMEYYLFQQIKLNEKQQNIINQDIKVHQLNSKKVQVNYSIFYGFETIVLLQFQGFNENSQCKQFKLERLQSNIRIIILKFSIPESIQIISFSYDQDSPQLFCYKSYLNTIIIKKILLLCSLERNIEQREKVINNQQACNQNQCLQYLKIASTFIYKQKNKLKEFNYQRNIWLQIIHIDYPNGNYRNIIKDQQLFISISKEIFFLFEQDDHETLRLKVYCNFHEKAIPYLTDRLRMYKPYVIDIQQKLIFFHTISNPIFCGRDEIIRFQFFVLKSF